MFSSTDTSFNLDSLLEDLQSLNTSAASSSAPLAVQSQGNSFPPKFSGHSSSGGSSSLYLPHPPATNKSPNMQNPKVKFAVLPDSSVNYHQNQNAKSSSGSGGSAKDDIDNILDMLNSPSMQQTGSTSLLSPYKPSAPNLSFSPEMAKSSAQVFSQFGLATELFTPDQQDDAGSDENHSVNVTPRKNADLLSSSWDESSVDLSLPLHSSLGQQKPAGQVAAQPAGMGKSLQTRSSSFNDGYASNNGSSNHGTVHASQSSKQTHFNKGAGGGAGTMSAPTPATSSLSATLSVDPMKLIDEKIAASKESQQRTRCSRVVVAGSSYSRGLKASVFSKFACDCLLCVHCNFRVLHFMNSAWDSSIDYMFVRNNMPNKDKLSFKLQASPDSVAYCCQCNWLSESKERTLVQGVTSDPQWVCTGH